MDINATLLGQMITFLLFIWFTMKFVWPPVVKALEARKNEIAEGLAAAERGHHELSLSQDKAKTALREARDESSKLLEAARAQADKIVEDARAEAQEEAKRIVERAASEVAQMESSAREGLKKQVSSLAVAGAQKILGRTIDAQAHNDILDELVKEL
ncbi:MAG: F0F1 ATP synthase subunit B [Legionellales bacterium]|nr:F0F1 ATP synthase subunit B [Legionellales bacterium]